jgi:NTE family protein
MSEKKQKVALVLSSGGARGLAHIGVIEALEENGFEIASIAGSSVGSLVGSFYACGMLDVYKKWALQLDRLDVFKLIDFTFSVQGFIRGEKAFKTLEDMIPDCNIEDMNIPFCAVATNLKEKKDVALSTGSMYKAIKASVAIPTVIKPQLYDNIELIDGGVTNPIPIDKVKRHKGDILVVSDVNAATPYRPPRKTKQRIEQEESYLSKIEAFKNRWSKLLPGNSSPKEKLGYFELLNRSIDLMQDRVATLIMQHYKPDITISVSRDAANTFEFYKAKELIEVGRLRFDEAFEQYEKAKKEALASESA